MYLLPQIGKVLVNGDNPAAGFVDDSDESSGEDEKQNDMNQEDVEEASEELRRKMRNLFLCLLN